MVISSFSSMELRKHYRCCCCCFSPSPTATLFMMMMTCLLLLLLLNSNSTVIAASSSSAAATGQLHPTAAAAAAEEGVYDIDYRGPETHSAVFPPPGHSQIQGRPNFLHRRTTGVAPAAAIPVTSRRQPPDQHKY
ncbi:unnamed protein product [Linum tenue]|uniref:Uncharacterized protein n=1 Tax=Linum tenue TaxID=586396 RepID=A0AAV0PM90_9ROSI|nr:unnamed protein product [Linum tenue]